MKSIGSNNCIFCKIIRGEIPSSIIHEDEHCIIMPDKFPAVKGQSLVISKVHCPYLFDLNDVAYKHLMGMVKKMAKALDKTYNPERTCVVVEGFEVQHVHIKMYPTPTKKLIMSGTRQASDEEMADTANNIRKNLEGC